MRILEDQDIEFVVDDYLKEYPESVKKKVCATIKQNRERLSQYGQGLLLREKLSNDLNNDFDFDVLSQKLFCKMEENETKNTGHLFYQWSYGSKLCKNSHSQMNNKIFKIGEDNYYYVKKPGKLLVRRERPPSMPKGSIYNANKFCNCIMLPYFPEIYNLSIVDKEPESKSKTIPSVNKAPRLCVQNVSRPENIPKPYDAETNKTDKAKVAVVVVSVVLFLILIGLVL